MGGPAFGSFFFFVLIDESSIGCAITFAVFKGFFLLYALFFTGVFVVDFDLKFDLIDFVYFCCETTFKLRSAVESEEEFSSELFSLGQNSWLLYGFMHFSVCWDALAETERMLEYFSKWESSYSWSLIERIKIVF